MRTESLWRSSSRRLTLLLLAVAVPPAATLVWLGLQLLQQDRALFAQRDLERRQVAMQSAIRSLEQSLAEAERTYFDRAVPHGMVRFRVSPQGLDAEPRGRVLWLPVARPLPPAEERRFADAERLEFQGNPDRALALYGEAARSSNAAVRAGGLLRAGRIYRQHRRWDEAVKTYRALATIDTVAIAGAPASLQARRTLCAVLAEAGRTSERDREVASLQADVLAGRWTLDRPAWELTVAEIESWTRGAVPAAADRRLFSAVADMLWNERSPSNPPRRVVVVEQTPVTVLWRANGGEVAALAISPSIVRAWADRARAAAPQAGTRLSVIAASGEILAGAGPAPDSIPTKAAASETGLPWTLVLDPGAASAATAEIANRRRLLTAGLVAILLLLAGGSYFLWHVMQRELAV